MSDDTIFAVNVDGTYNVLQACRRHRVRALVFASSMAYGHGGVYGLTKVLGEELCRGYHVMTQAPTVCLRYHDFVPKPYLQFGNMLVRNGVDRRDVAAATVASLQGALDGRVGFMVSVVHHTLGAPAEVVADFAGRGPTWLEQRLPGTGHLIEKYGITLPARLEQHDMSEAERLLGWKPAVNFLTFIEDLRRRDAAGEDVRSLWAAGQIPEAGESRKHIIPAAHASPALARDS